MLTKAYAAKTPTSPLEPFEITRRNPGPNDVVIDIKYAGICHSDIHQARDEWSKGIFPMVPGHEIGGHVVSVGANVSNFAVGDSVGVGCIVDSCRSCNACRSNEEQYCFTGMVGTYNSTYKYKHCEEYNEQGGAPTYGGYSQRIVVDANYVLKIPSNLDLAAATPLLCAGITVFSPMIHFDLRPHHRFAVAGLGGLGHMAAKFGHAFGCHTSVLSRGQSKRDSAINELKADAFVDMTDAEAVKAAAGTFDFIIDTIAAPHDMNVYVSLLKTNGKIVLVGAPPTEFGGYSVAPFPLIIQRKSIGGSLIGGIKETQDMLDFCGRHNIVCEIEKINADQINVAYERTVKSDVKYRFVIDTATI